MMEIEYNDNLKFLWLSYPSTFFRGYKYYFTCSLNDARAIFFYENDVFIALPTDSKNLINFFETKSRFDEFCTAHSTFMAMYKKF